MYKSSCSYRYFHLKLLISTESSAKDSPKLDPRPYYDNHGFQLYLIQCGFVTGDILCCVLLQKESAEVPERSPERAASPKSSGTDYTKRDCELGMFAKWSSVKLIILSDNESRAPQG